MGYLLAACMSLSISLLPMKVGTLILVFVLGGIYLAMAETLEDSFCAELTLEEQHGMAFGTLAPVNGIGDFASSLAVGLFWTAFGTGVAFGCSTILCLASSLLVLRTARS